MNTTTILAPLLCTDRCRGPKQIANASYGVRAPQTLVVRTLVHTEGAETRCTPFNPNRAVVPLGQVAVSVKRSLPFHVVPLPFHCLSTYFHCDLTTVLRGSSPGDLGHLPRRIRAAWLPAVGHGRTTFRFAETVPFACVFHCLTSLSHCLSLVFSLPVYAETVPFFVVLP